MISVLEISHSNKSITLSPDSLIIVKNATESDYLEISNEDLKIEFDGECLYIHSPASKRHEKLVFQLLVINRLINCLLNFVFLAG